MKKVKLTLTILVLCLFSYATVIAAPLPDLSAEGAILIEAKTGTILYAKNINSLFYPASTTKVLTCLILAEEGTPDELFKKSPESIANVPTDSSHIGLARGDRYTAFDGLHGILMSSDNYISYDMAVENAGSISLFADKMNQKAKLLGARHSHFVNPHGYHDPNHYTTPYDLALITRAAFANPEVLEIAGTSNYPFKILNTNTTLNLKHTAALFDQQSPYYNPHVIAAKTGYHTPAGRTLVAKAVYDDIELIGVVMKSGEPARFKDMNALFKYGSENFKLIGDATQGYRIENDSYSSWSKPYIDYALENKWISPHLESYQKPLTQRDFIHLLNQVLPESYVSPWVLENSSSIGPSKLNDKISGRSASILLGEVAEQLVPTSTFDLVASLGVDALQSDVPLTLEQALCALYRFDRILTVTPPYIFSPLK